MYPETALVGGGIQPQCSNLVQKSVADKTVQKSEQR